MLVSTAQSGKAPWHLPCQPSQPQTNPQQEHSAERVSSSGHSKALSTPARTCFGEQAAKVVAVAGPRDQQGLLLLYRLLKRLHIHRADEPLEEGLAVGYLLLWLHLQGRNFPHLLPSGCRPPGAGRAANQRGTGTGSKH